MATPVTRPDDDGRFKVTGNPRHMCGYSVTRPDDDGRFKVTGNPRHMCGYPCDKTES